MCLTILGRYALKGSSDYYMKISFTFFELVLTRVINYIMVIFSVGFSFPVIQVSKVKR